MKLSLTMIVRDAESTLACALASVAGLCDELIVVDTGSLDGSKKIAEQMGAKIYDFPWNDDFSAARNYSFQHCGGDWILWLDADDVVPPASMQRLLEVKQSSLLNEAIDAVYLPYQYAFNAVNKCELTLYRERILRRKSAPEWHYPVHERVQSQTERELHLHDIFIEHRPSADRRAARDRSRNLRIIEKALSAGERSPRMLFYYGNELYDHERLDGAIAAYKEFLDTGGRAWERYWAIRSIGKCYSALRQLESALLWGLRAIEEDSARAEAFNDVGIIHYKEKRIHDAVRFFSAATQKQKPQTSFVEDAHYEWLPYDYLSSCYMKDGNYLEALENGIKALHDNPRSERLQENIDFLSKLVS